MKIFKISTKAIYTITIYYHKYTIYLLFWRPHNWSINSSEVIWYICAKNIKNSLMFPRCWRVSSPKNLKFCHPLLTFMSSQALIYIKILISNQIWWREAQACLLDLREPMRFVLLEKLSVEDRNLSEFISY